VELRAAIRDERRLLPHDVRAVLARRDHAGQSTATFIPDEFKGKFFKAPASDQGICNAVTAVGAGLVSPLTAGTGQYGWKDDYIAHHEPFQYYASTANPHHLTLPTNANGSVPLRALRTVGTDTQHWMNG
jgi:phospholipase C